MPSARTPNKRNELRSRVVADYASGGATVTLDYDRNGSLTSDGERHRYVFNPFGQLVRILDYTTSEPVAEFAYSGVGHRISEKTDIDDSTGTGIPDATLDADDPTFYIATDPHGRRVATFREGDTHPKETFVWTPAGVSGPGGNVGGALILRDRVDDAAIPSKWANEAAGDTRPERHYHCSDSRLSVVALIALGEGGDGPTGVLAEQYRYSATGVPYGIPLGDVDGNFRVEIDGEVVVDSAIIADIEQEAVYQVRADLNLDGLVDSADIAIADAAAGAELGRGRLSQTAIANRVGWLRSELNTGIALMRPGQTLVRSDISMFVSGKRGPRPDGVRPNEGLEIHIHGNWCGPGFGGDVWDGCPYLDEAGNWVTPGGGDGSARGVTRQKCGKDDNGWDRERRNCPTKGCSDSCCMAHDLCMYATCVSYFFDGLIPGQKSQCHKICDASMCACLKACAKHAREGILIGIDNLLMQITFCQWNDGATNDRFDTSGCDNGGGGFVPPPRHLDPRVADPRRELFR